MIRRFALAALLAVTACSGAQKPAMSVSAAPVGGGDMIVGALPDPALKKGECGMILWTLEEQQPAAILKVISDKGADIAINGAALRFAVTETSGAAGFGVFEEQTMAAPGYTATVRMRFGLGFDGGSYLERGLVTIESETGWRTVIPAVGVAGCLAK